MIASSASQTSSTLTTLSKAEATCVSGGWLTAYFVGGTVVAAATYAIGTPILTAFAVGHMLYSASAGIASYINHGDKEKAILAAKEKVIFLSIFSASCIASIKLLKIKPVTNLATPMQVK